MPRVGGFRDPRTLTLPSQVSLFLYRQERSRFNAWTSPLPKSSHQHAQEVARTAQELHERPYNPDSLNNGRMLSANHGVTVAVKDNFVTTDLPTSCASKILRGYVAPEKSTVVRLMEEAGMIILGKTNMDEFGMGSHSIHSAYGPVLNHQLGGALSAGGSSGGSALAVAADMCNVAIGTDTGGSIRLPASYLKLFGFKPSYGLISRNGVVPYANSLDTVGIIGKTYLDILLLFQILNVPDDRDPTCLTEQSRARIQKIRRERLSASTGSALHVLPGNVEARPGQYFKHLRNPRTKKYPGIVQASRSRRIGVPAEYNIAEMLPEVRQAWIRTLAYLEAEGHEIVSVSLPSTKQALSAYYVLAPAEASSNLAKYDGVRYGSSREHSERDNDGVLYSGHRKKQFGAEVKRRILLGAYSLSAGAMDNYFIQAQKVRRQVQDDFNLVFKMPHPLLKDSRSVQNGVDFIVCPTAPTFPPYVKPLRNSPPLESYLNDVFTVPASLAGLPAISAPAAPDPEHPSNSYARAIGMQVIGQYGDDYSVLEFVSSQLNFYEGDGWIDETLRMAMPIG